MNYLKTEVLNSINGIIIQADSVTAWMNDKNQLQLNGAYTVNDLKVISGRPFVIKCMLKDAKDRILLTVETLKHNGKNHFDTFRIIETNIETFVNKEDIDKAVFFATYE